MDPSKLSTMYTCILLAAEQRGWYCTTIQFDLPLEKTREMVLVKGKLTLLSGVNIQLGGFHYLVSSTGSFGTIMTGNGADASSIHARPFII